MFKEIRMGIIYSAMGRYSNIIINLVVQSVLARLLTPDDFGIVAVLLVFLTFFQLLSDFGIGPAVIQHKGLDKADLQSIFSFSLYLSLLMALLFSSSSKLVGIFYSNPVYEQLVPIMSVVLFFSSAFMVPFNLAQKNKEFKFVNVLQVSGSIINAIVSIVFAYYGYKYYSLLFGALARSVFLFVGYYLNQRIKLQFLIDFTSVKKIMGFSTNQFMFNFLNFFSRNLDNLLIGRAFSEATLGYYNRAYQISLYPNQMLTSVITPVIHPVLSSHQNNKQRIEEAYLTLTTFLSTLGFPISIFLFFNAEEVIYILFGDQWSNSVPIFKLFSLTIGFLMLGSTTGGIFQSGNRTDLLLRAGIFVSSLNFLAVIIGLYFKNIFLLTALISTVNFLDYIFLNYLIMKRMLDSSMLKVVQAITKPLIVTSMIGVTQYSLQFLNYTAFINVIIRGIAFVVIFLVGLFLTRQHVVIKDILRR